MSSLCPPKSATLEALQAALPQTPLYGDAAATGTGWLLSPTPYPLTASQADILQHLGDDLWALTKAVDALYKAAQKTPALDWVRAVLQAGKPQALLQFAGMNRFKSHLPRVLRPDLLVTPDGGFALSEIDAVPGGLGFTGALAHAYRQAGFDLAGSADPIPKSFLRMLLSAAPEGVETPSIAVVVSDESADYRAELTWLVDAIRADYPPIALVHPRQLTMERDSLGFLDEAGAFTPIHLVYRFFELFDLANIPNIELIQFALKKGRVACTPPFKPHMEEKAVLALLHHPFLAEFWHQHLTGATMEHLRRLVPESWLLDNRPVPPTPPSRHPSPSATAGCKIIASWAP